MKVETHNHPTAISPFPGAATGAGGEIRDEGATGRGGKPKAGLAGFSVSHLRIPGFEQPWERDYGRPARIASALDIMVEGPLGAAAFNNEFGRPNILGYFRTFETEARVRQSRATLRGYHKPIMIAGGVGNVRRMHVEKSDVPPGAKVIRAGARARPELSQAGAAATPYCCQGFCTDAARRIVADRSAAQSRHRSRSSPPAPPHRMQLVGQTARASQRRLLSTHSFNCG